MEENEYKFQEHREGHYVKISNGKIVDTATIGEVVINNWRRKWPSVDPGILEVSLALVAVFAVIAAMDTGRWMKIAALIAYYASICSTYYLLVAYIFLRLPMGISHYYAKKKTRDLNKFPGDIITWLLLIWPFTVLGLVLKSALNSDPFYPRGFQASAELGYLLLFWSLLLGGLGLVPFTFIFA